jgi:hypothetical protein
MGVRAAAAFTLASFTLSVTGPVYGQQAGDPISAIDHEDALMLRDGTVVRGQVLERVEGDHVTIRLDDGRVVRIDSSDLQQPEAVSRSSKGVSALSVLAVLGLAGVAGGGGALIGSAFVSDPDTRKPMQIGGGIALGAGLTLVIVVGAIGLSQSIVVK